MKNKDRVTLVLAVNATGSHKIPVAIIGKAAVPLCFKSPRAPCPLPYFSQPSAWMDGDVYEKWFNTVFVPAVRERTRLLCVLDVDNCGAHNKLEHPQVAICPLPPNVTSVHQPLDAGIIAALKRCYKGRLLSLVIGAFERSRVAPSALARVSGPPLDSGEHGCPVSVAGSPESIQTGETASSVDTAGNEAVTTSPGPTRSRHSSRASADSAASCRSRSSGGQVPARGAACAPVGRVGCGDSPSTIGGDGAASEAGAAPRGWTGGSGTATRSAGAATACQGIGVGGADFGGANRSTPSIGPGGYTSVPLYRSTEGVAQVASVTRLGAPWVRQVPGWKQGAPRWLRSFSRNRRGQRRASPGGAPFGWGKRQYSIWVIWLNLAPVCHLGRDRSVPDLCRRGVLKALWSGEFSGVSPLHPPRVPRRASR